MSEYHNDFSDTWEGQEVKLPLHEVVRLYVAEAKMQAREEVTKAKGDAEHARKMWLDAVNKADNERAEKEAALAECRRLNSMLDALNGGE